MGVETVRWSEVDAVGVEKEKGGGLKTTLLGSFHEAW